MLVLVHMIVSWRTNLPEYDCRSLVYLLQINLLTHRILILQASIKVPMYPLPSLLVLYHILYPTSQTPVQVSRQYLVLEPKLIISSLNHRKYPNILFKRSQLPFLGAERKQDMVIVAIWMSKRPSDITYCKEPIMDW
jgi:hypothetical protein